MNVLPVSFPGQGHNQSLSVPDDLPKTVARTLNQGSSPMSMDFHPSQQTLLLGLHLLNALLYQHTGVFFLSVHIFLAVAFIMTFYVTN